MRLSTRLKIIFSFTLVAILFIFLNLTNFSQDIKNSFYSFSAPLQQSLWQAGENASDFLGSIFEARIIQEENQKLKLQNQELLSKISFLNELKKENEFLREAMGLGLEKELQLKLAQIVSKDISEDSILIDKGSRDNVLSGFPVITGQGALFGKIGRVFDNFSEVILISNKETSFDAKISGKEIYGIIKGKGNSEFYLDLIPKDKEISEGDLVVTSALGGIFPEGLLIGEVQKVQKSDVELFQTAEVKPQLNFGELKNLFIITDF